MENEHTVHVPGLSAFNLSSFSSSQGSEGEKASFDSVTPSDSCFNEVVATQDGDISRSVHIPVEGVPYESSTIVTSVCQDNLLTSTQVTVLSVPDSALFEVVQGQAVQQVSVGEVGNAAAAICSEKPAGEQENAATENIEDQPVLLQGAKKRKGGWPKGKRRKKDGAINKPKAPVTGYVRFLNSRRDRVKQQHPQLTFPEITKLLGLEWNNLLPEEKQKFLDEAEEDKKRYSEEVKAYQQTEEYQAFLKRQQAKRAKHNLGASALEDVIGETHEGMLAQQQEENDSNELFCKTCNQYFSSPHNKREHMFGRQHLQKLLFEFEKEADKSSTQAASSGNNTCELATPTSGTAASGPASSTSVLQPEMSIPQFTETFMEQNLDRELEIRELRKSVKVSHEQNVLLAKQIEELKVLLQKVENDMSSAKAYGASLTAQLNSLRMVPTLFGVQLQLNFTG